MITCQMLLRDYVPKKAVSETSIAAYHSLEQKNNHSAIIYRHLLESVDGYTDGELQKVLASKGIVMQRCNVGARRHDINRLLGASVIINSNGETRRSTRSGKREKVWRVNEYEFGFGK